MITYQTRQWNLPNACHRVSFSEWIVEYLAGNQFPMFHQNSDICIAISFKFVVYVNTSFVYYKMISMTECLIKCCPDIHGIIQQIDLMLRSQFPPFRYFPNFSPLPKQNSDVKYRVYIWQVSSQLSCDDTCQIWMWFEESNMYFARSKILLTEKLTNGALVTSTPNPQMFVVLIMFRTNERIERS